MFAAAGSRVAEFIGKEKGRAKTFDGRLEADDGETIDTGAGNKSDEKADQSENGKHAVGGKVTKCAAAERRVTEKAGKIR